MDMERTIVSQRASRTDRVYEALAHDLARGRWLPGAAISVKDNAVRFAVSPTPVREAMERLVGAGLVSISNDRSGFVVPRVGLHGYLSLIDTFAMLMEGIWQPGHADEVADTLIDPTDPIGTTDALFGRVLKQADNHVATWLIGRLAAILSPYRMVEPRIIPDWEAGMTALSGGLRGPGAPRAIRLYAQTRRSFAALLVDQVERGGAASISNISQV